MKSIVSLLSLLAIVSLFACNSNETEKAKKSSETTPTTSTTNSSTTASVNHYICPNNCVGGASDTKGNCPTCASPLNHNAAFHTQNNDASQFTLPMPGTAPAPQANPTANPSPAQNAKGVYHYTCAKGCAGGAGSAQSCATCGGTLAHNAGYHQ